MSADEAEGRWRKRRPSLTGVIMQDVSHGAERTRAWPRKRTAAEKAKTKEQNEWFKQVQWASKYLAPGIMKNIMEARAGTPFLPRDIFTMQMAGTMCSFVTPNGRRIHSMATYQAVSESLDAITQFENYLLIRGPEGWVGVPYAPNASPWWWSPPSDDLWVKQNGTGWDLNVVFDGVKGASVSGGPTVTGNRHAIATRPIPFKDNSWKLMFHQTPLKASSPDGLVGLYLVDSISGRMETIGKRQSSSVAFQRWPGLVGASALDVTYTPAANVIADHYMVEYDGSTLTYSISADAFTWHQLHTESATAYLSNKADRIGFGMQYNGAGGVRSYTNIDRWVFEQV